MYTIGETPMRKYVLPVLIVRGNVTTETLGSISKYTFEPHQGAEPPTKFDSVGEPDGAIRTTGDTD
jgi:hypothetical protein